ncbi:hypothetical protein Rsub_08593 [Raphidocelis subcapitata]|uniref:Uncharacterized protein n=1 Tax=Raphidocelis subcapitata TaxID=307507 RepID=A0A2V0P6W7_9CHLO|nr:hypothetical protein Rsub_08593 [Raphidocelis subcapitata]|eukprot:GBF95611.1 hypothetical protein Rsub_08593 [Raphidocelis subcapitata]
MPPGADAVAQARALLNTLRTLAAQHEQVLAAYERHLDVITSGGAAKLSKAPANKRPPPAPAEPEGPEAKKARLVAEQQAQRNNLWHECYKVLDRCRRNQRAEAFKKPVDPIRLKIPDYPTVVKNPMDLQTVGDKLKVRAYKEPGEFAADMRLIWDNAMLYNGRHHPIGANAVAMSEFFEKAWGPLQIEKYWAIQLQQEELALQALEGNADGLPNSDLSRQLKEKRDALGHFIAARDFQEGLPPGALGPCEPGRSMSFEERRKLSAHLASLPGEKMERVVDIVEAGAPPPADAAPDAELELDLDALPDAVLWQLKEYADAVLAPPTAPPKKGGATKGGAASKAVPNKSAPGKAPQKGAAAAAGGTPTAGTPAPVAGGSPALTGGLPPPGKATPAPPGKATPAPPGKATPAPPGKATPAPPGKQQHQQQQPQEQQQQAGSPQLSDGEALMGPSTGAPAPAAEAGAPAPTADAAPEPGAKPEAAAAPAGEAAAAPASAAGQAATPVPDGVPAPAPEGAAPAPPPEAENPATVAAPDSPPPVPAPAGAAAAPEGAAAAPAPASEARDAPAAEAEAKAEVKPEPEGGAGAAAGAEQPTAGAPVSGDEQPQQQQQLEEQQEPEVQQQAEAPEPPSTAEQADAAGDGADAAAAASGGDDADDVTVDEAEAMEEDAPAPQ